MKRERSSSEQYNGRTEKEIMFVSTKNKMKIFQLAQREEQALSVFFSIH
jgi:hypothetical protein